MAIKTLSNTNRYLKKGTVTKQIITNVSSNTAIETGKPASTYVSRSAKSGRFVVMNDSTPRKK